MLITSIIHLLRFENDQWPINLRDWKADANFTAKLLGYSKTGIYWNDNHVKVKFWCHM